MSEKAIATFSEAQLLRIPDEKRFEAALVQMSTAVEKANSFRSAAKAATMVDALAAMGKALGITEEKSRSVEGLIVEIRAKVGFLEKTIRPLPAHDRGKIRHGGETTGSQPSKKQVLLEAGLTENVVRECRAIAKALPSLDAVKSYVNDCKKKNVRPSIEGAKRVGQTSGADDYDGDEWYTPAAWVEMARTVLGGTIDLDPASNLHAQKTVRASRFYTKKENGLKQPWGGNVFCNPPYSATLVQEFADKLIDEHGNGHIKSAIFLVNNCTDTAWFHSLLTRFPVCFTKGRIAFENRKGLGFATRQGQAIFYTGRDVALFVEIFSREGVVLERLDP